MRTSKKRALLIGINYVGQDAELSGCVNDVVDARAMCAALGYAEVCVLFDGRWAGEADPADDRVGGTRPTLANMTAAFQWLVAGAGPGDRLYLHYSGHGGQLRERVPGSEATGMDDTLVPVDYETAGMIRDDDLHAWLVEPLRGSGAALRAVLDCCHSGTGLDLRHNLSLAGRFFGGRGAGAGAPEDAGQLGPLVSRLTADLVRAELAAWFGPALADKHLRAEEGAGAAELFREWSAEGSALVPGATIHGRSVAARVDAADVLAVSGCADRQTSADAEFGSRAGGALTHYLLEALRPCVAARALGAGAGAGAPPAWPAATELLRGLRRHLRAGGYTQVPQVSSEMPFTAETRFSLA